ncbi:MAG: serine hydrolase [Bacteroidia bacterium]|nr:serine hydrolase [Bacteroidia bacterium]
MGKATSAFILILGCVIISDCSCTKSSDQDFNNRNSQIIAQWESVSDSILKSSGVPGMIIGIWAPDRNLEWVKGIGTANKATNMKPDPNMKFRIGSLTKTYTYTVLLQLVDENKLSLSDKLSLFLPNFPNAGSITIKMLCNHTSGIPDYTDVNQYFITLFNSPFKKWTSQDMIDLIKNEPFYFTPGTNFKYSNTNTIIAGMIIEKITGNAVGAEIQHRILDKLNLTNTIYPSDNRIPDSFIHGYGWGFETNTAALPDVSEAYDPSLAGAAGAIISDVYDLKTWVGHLYKGTLLKPETQAQRLTLVPAPGEDCEFYGLGIMFKTNPPMWGHTGTIFGSKNWAGYFPSENATIVINYNSTTAKPMVLATRLMNIYREAIKN